MRYLALVFHDGGDEVCVLMRHDDDDDEICIYLYVYMRD